MTKSFRPMVAAALLAGAALSLHVGPAQAQSYPRLTGMGEDLTVDYGPMGQGNLVGGGRVMVSRSDAMNLDVVHLDMIFTQRPREGYVPLTIGAGEAQEIIWVPATMVDMMRRARAGMPTR
ncbi:hypothetical protein [Falsiroseomonas sp.]|uniref:hypothetical protein n=1 Tax=Falsiroseomonas sp. TaxID=2870721 RepID=UPI003567F44B